jgi:hypothetical protein
MNLRTIQLIKNKLIQQKLLAESNIEHFLLDVNLTPEEKSEKVIQALNDLKNSSSNIEYWDDFIKNNIIIPDEGEITNKKNS